MRRSRSIPGKPLSRTDVAPRPLYSSTRGTARARSRTRRPGRGARGSRAGHRHGGLRHRGARYREDRSRHAVRRRSRRRDESARRRLRRPVDPAAARPVSRLCKRGLRRAGGSSPTGAASHEIQTLLIAELRRATAPDRARSRGCPVGGRRDARRGHGARPADRLAPGAPRPHLPPRRGAAGSPTPRDGRRGRARGLGVRRARATLRERGRFAHRRPRERGVRRHRRQPVLRHRAGRLAGVGRPAADGHHRRACACVPARRRRAASGRAGLGRAGPRREPAARCSDAELERSGGGARAPAAARGRATARALPSRAGSARDSIEHSGRRTAPAAQGDPRRPARHGRRPGGHRPPRRGRRRGGRRRRVRARRCAPGRGGWSRIGRRSPTTAVPRTSSTGCRREEQGAVLEEVADGRLSRRPASGCLLGDRAGDRGLSRSSATTRRSVAASGSCPASTGSRATARTRGKAALDAIAILEPLGPSSELARAYSTVSQLEMLADDLDATLVWGTRALDLATQLGDEQTRAHALVNIGTARLNSDGTDRDAPRGARRRGGRRGSPRGRAGARQPRATACSAGSDRRSHSDTRSRQPRTAPGTSSSSSPRTPRSSSPGSVCEPARGARPSGAPDGRSRAAWSSG